MLKSLGDGGPISKLYVMSPSLHRPKTLKKARNVDFETNTVKSALYILCSQGETHMLDFQHMVHDRTNLFPRGLHDGVAGR